MTRQELEQQLAKKKQEYARIHRSLPKAKEIQQGIEELEAQLNAYQDNDAPAAEMKPVEEPQPQSSSPSSGGGDIFNSGGGAMNTAKDHGVAFQSNYISTAAHSRPSSSSIDELLQPLIAVRQQLSRLSLPESLKEDVLDEVKGAEKQATKPNPNFQRIASKLKIAVEALEDVEGAASVKTLLEQAIAWCNRH